MAENDESGPGLSHDRLEGALMDMAARRYMNAFDNLRNQNFEAAVFEAGAGHALQQFQLMAEHHRETANWPGDTPNDDYIAIIEAMDNIAANNSGSNSGAEVH